MKIDTSDWSKGPEDESPKWTRTLCIGRFVAHFTVFLYYTETRWCVLTNIANSAGTMHNACRSAWNHDRIFATCAEAKNMVDKIITDWIAAFTEGRSEGDEEEK